ncbi:hypothetical protein MtrunA17_Chr7g0219321 [Medicago truncatula]|uniref:Uncharacterized protein n=1 Tax=Medicago truncatula TaxID=3880 RepID=A0A396H0J8_MEDTR|nr:hypothetical protein MtrunA17_Chr7g0219321 [Medicago truncatula]
MFFFDLLFGLEPLACCSVTDSACCCCAAYRTNAAEFLEENLEIPSYPEILFPIKLQLWAKAAEKGRPDGGKGRKGRMYGLGPLADNVVHGDLFYVPPPPESSSRSTEPPLEMQAMIQ